VKPNTPEDDLVIAFRQLKERDQLALISIAKAWAKATKKVPA